MRGFLTASVAATLLMALGLSAQSDDVPRLNAEPLCRGIVTHACLPQKEVDRIYLWTNASRASRRCGNDWRKVVDFLTRRQGKLRWRSDDERRVELS